MLLSESWMRKVQDYEHRIQVIKLRIEAKRFEHNLNALIREHEEEKRAAQEQYFELSKSTFQVLNTSKGEVLDSSPIFDSYEEQSEPLLNLFPKDHGVEVDEERAFDPYPTHDLFHDAPIDHVVCELNDPPIYDSYELEADVVSSLSALANEEIAETVLKRFCATLEQQGPDMIEFDTNPWRDELGKAGMPIFDEYLEAHESREPEQLVCEADHEEIHQVCEIGCQVEVLQPDLKHLSSKPDLLGLHIESSPSILKGDEVLHNEGLKFGAEHEYSDLNALVLNLISLAAAQFGLKLACSSENPTIHVQAQLKEPFVAPMNTFSSLKNSEYSRENTFKNCYTFKKKGVHSDLHDMLTLGAQGESKGKAHVLLFLDLYGRGLLDLCIKDDDLRDNSKYYSSQSKYGTCIKASI